MRLYSILAKILILLHISISRSDITLKICPGLLDLKKMSLRRWTNKMDPHLFVSSES